VNSIRAQTRLKRQKYKLYRRRASANQYADCQRLCLYNNSGRFVHCILPTQSLI